MQGNADRSLESLGEKANDLRDPALQEFVEYVWQVIGTPVALITELGAERQTFLANVGFARDWTSLKESFCAHAVLQDGVFEVPDATQDPRFADSPLVTGEAHIRFYAGVPVREGAGEPRNALCVLDTVPRELTDFQRRTLALLARQVEARLALGSREAEAREERSRAKEASALLRQVTDSLPVRVAYVDREMRYRFLNEEYARQFGRPLEQSLGRTVAEVAGDAAFAAGRPLLERALAGESFAETLQVEYPFGRVWVDVSFEPDFGDDGEVRGVVTHVADVTARRAAERAAIVARESLASTLRTAGVATYDWDVPNDRLVGNDLLASLYGVDAVPGGGPSRPTSRACFRTTASRPKPPSPARSARASATRPSTAWRARTASSGGSSPGETRPSTQTAGRFVSPASCSTLPSACWASTSGSRGCSSPRRCRTGSGSRCGRSGPR